MKVVNEKYGICYEDILEEKPDHLAGRVTELLSYGNCVVLEPEELYLPPKNFVVLADPRKKLFRDHLLLTVLKNQYESVDLFILQTKSSHWLAQHEGGNIRIAPAKRIFIPATPENRDLTVYFVDDKRKSVLSDILVQFYSETQIPILIGKSVCFNDRRTTLIEFFKSTFVEVAVYQKNLLLKEHFKCY